MCSPLSVRYGAIEMTDDDDDDDDDDDNDDDDDVGID